MLEEPIEREARPAWPEVPQNLVRQLEKLLGDKIIHGDILWGGYAPSAIFTAVCASGKKVFIKGTHPGDDSHGTQTLRQEIEVYETLPGIKDFSPAYLGCASDGGEDGWMLAVFEHINTRPTLPWTQEKIEKAFALLGRLHALPKPASLRMAEDKNFVRKFMLPEGGWFKIRDDFKISARFLSLFDNADEARNWLLSALPKLCAYQEKVACLSSPRGMLHQDLRGDNILFDQSGRAYLIDWPNACYGPVVLDIAALISAVAAESSFEAEDLLRLYEKITGVKPDRATLAAALASFSGYLADNAYRAIPLKLPRLRWLQKNLLRAMLRWAASLMDIAPPPDFRR